MPIIWKESKNINLNGIVILFYLLPLLTLTQRHLSIAS